MKSILQAVLPLMSLTLTSVLAAQTATYSVQGQACPGSNGKTPVISNQGLPQLGVTFRITLADAAASVTAYMTVGDSTTQWGSFRLPYEMTPLGAPGCRIYANSIHTFQLTTRGTGTASCPLTVPNNPVLIGVKFFNQFLVMDAAANPLGMVTTACGAGTIGT